MKTKAQSLLNRFLDRFTIKNKIIVSCLPFILLSYLMIFLSIVTMAFRQSKTIVYEQTTQTMVEKSGLINAKLKTYDFLTEKFLYYSPEMLHYMTTRQETASSDEKETLKTFISDRTTSLFADHIPTMMTLMLFNQWEELYTNNAIHTGTISSADKMRTLLYPAAKEVHGKMLIASNPYKSGFLTLARNVYMPVLEKSDEETGFLLVDIQKSELRNLMKLTQNQDAIYVLLLDHQGELLINASSQTDSYCLELLNGSRPRYIQLKSTPLQYGGCELVTLINERVLFQDIYRTLLFEIMIIIFSVLLILTAVVLTGNTISGQVKRFMLRLTATNQIDKNAYIPIESRDEFRDLSVVYNDMLSRINHLTETVYLKELLTREAQLQSLQAQINPHFLYNTLDCINGLVELEKKEEAKKTVNALASIMRMSIKGEAFLTIGEELTYIERYLYIQRIRFQERILFLVEIPTALHRYMIPKLILQPLLENAILHGVSGLTRGAMVGVFGQEEPDAVLLSVKDNGIGISQELIDQLSLPEPEPKPFADPASHHIGILNIKRRLALIYGEGFGLTAHALTSGGSCFTIRIPKTKPIESGSAH